MIKSKKFSKNRAIKHGFFNSSGGVSKNIYKSLNCGPGSNDNSVNVKKNLNILDLTGAGDLFAAGYLHGFLNNFSEKECLEKGTEMSSKIIQIIVAILNN